MNTLRIRGTLFNILKTDSLTHCRLVNLIYVSLACADGNSKHVEVVDDNSVTFRIQFLLVVKCFSRSLVMLVTN